MLTTLLQLNIPHATLSPAWTLNLSNMDFQSQAFKSFQPPDIHYGGEKEQMLNLNQRLETYLNRVKLLDEENTKLAKEIQMLRRNHHGHEERRRVLDEELWRAREEVDMVWKEKVYAEVDVAKLTKELQTLDLQLQRETQAQMEANAEADQSRRELEEERRAQIWLREKVSQLEHEVKSLIQTHQEEVANMEAVLMQTKVTPARRPAAQRGPNLLELGQEYNQRAARAWQEAAEAYQGQLARLEESMNETRQRLVQVNKEKSESVLKLQNLDREMLGLQDLREHLESTVDQRRESHCQDVQMLQEHLEALEIEKHALNQKMDQLLQENRGLMQMKLSLSLEVATYRTLLDSESLKGELSLQKQPRNIYRKDAVFSPWGFKDNYQLSPSPKTTSSSVVHSMTGKTKPPVITATPIHYQKYMPRGEKLDISKKKVEDNDGYQQPKLTPYPKVLKDGAVENFRPQEVNEKVTYAEPLSPPDEEKTLDLENNEDNWSEQSEKQESSLKMEAALNEASLQLVEPALTEDLHSFSMKSEPMENQIDKEEIENPQAPKDAWVGEEIVSKTEQPLIESSLNHQVESSSNLEEPFNVAGPDLVEEAFTEELCSVTVKSQQPFSNEEIERSIEEPIDAWVEKESLEDTKVVQEQVESSDSETDAFVEPNFDAKSSSPASECEPQDSFQIQLGEIVKDDFPFDSVGASMDDISPPREKLYPDGEEMDTWDSVIEQNQVLKADDLEQPHKVLKQHAQPEEDNSAREVQQQKQDLVQDEGMQTKLELQIANAEQKDSLKKDLTDKSEDDEQEDSENVSVSWRTELEGDSYAQDNTLADTRPLIRYKSDETDANTQASHVDDVDNSSDGEHDKKVEETGSSTWIDDQTRRFGTMEDLCEEAEGEALDEEYEYLRKEEMYMQEDENKTQQELIKTVFEEELDTDKLVEQELENLTTEYYTTQFVHQQASAKDILQHESPAEQPIAWGEALEGMPETSDKEDFFTSEALVNQKSEEQFEEPQQRNNAEENEVQELAEAKKDKHNSSMVSHGDTAEDITEVRKEIVWSSTSQERSIDNLSFGQKEQAEEKQSIFQDMLTSHMDQSIYENESNKPSSTVQEVIPNNGVEIRDTTPEEKCVPEELDTELSKVLATTQWEVLENPTENVEQDKINSDLKGRSSDNKVDHDSLSPTDKPLNMSPESVHDEGDLFIVKESNELVKTGKTNLDDMFNINANNDFWVSPLETGATYQPQPDDVDNRHVERKLGFGDMEGRRSENVAAEKSDMAIEQKEVSHMFIKSVGKGEIVHSEESEDDSDAMSSGEE
ncbi:nestin [Eucyclogobius newberryi]|uniref:nestin n=1 Tax=Eucyclogobius newberryi TaxID=166745 RepID=UPI003B5BF428